MPYSRNEMNGKERSKNGRIPDSKGAKPAGKNCGANDLQLYP
jgi:hypothetical protein